MGFFDDHMGGVSFPEDVEVCKVEEVLNLPAKLIEYGLVSSVGKFGKPYYYLILSVKSKKDVAKFGITTGATIIVHQLQELEKLGDKILPMPVIIRAKEMAGGTGYYIADYEG